MGAVQAHWRHSRKVSVGACHSAPADSFFSRKNPLHLQLKYLNPFLSLKVVTSEIGMMAEERRDSITLLGNGFNWRLCQSQRDKSWFPQSFRSVDVFGFLIDIFDVSVFVHVHKLAICFVQL